MRKVPFPHFFHPLLVTVSPLFPDAPGFSVVIVWKRERTPICEKTSPSTVELATAAPVAVGFAAAAAGVAALTLPVPLPPALLVTTLAT
mgnify:CR=1 FL=1